MKKLVRWGTTAVLIGGAVAGSLFTGGLRALALTQAQIVEMLSAVPMFTITDSNGSPLVASPASAEGDQGSVAGVFVSREDAQAFLQRISSQNPEIANNVRVTPVSLGEVYQLATASANQNSGLRFAYFAERDQVESAVQILRQGGQQVSAEQFNGVPLFLAKAGADGGYLTISQNGEQVIPIFFEREGLQRLVDRVRQQQPDLATSIEIQVVNLEGVIQTLESSNNPELSQVILIPTADSIEYIRSLQPNQR
jgi:hypothetical protein